MKKSGASDQIAIVNQQEVTWQHVARLIARLNRDHRSSLKAGGSGAILFVNESF